MAYRAHSCGLSLWGRRARGVYSPSRPPSFLIPWPVTTGLRGRWRCADVAEIRATGKAPAEPPCPGCGQKGLVAQLVGRHPVVARDVGWRRRRPHRPVSGALKSRRRLDVAQMRPPVTFVPLSVTNSAPARVNRCALSHVFMQQRSERRARSGEHLPDRQRLWSQAVAGRLLRNHVVLGA